MTTDQGTIEMDAKYRAAVTKLQETIAKYSHGEDLTKIGTEAWRAIQSTPLAFITEAMTPEEVFILGVGAGISASGKVILEVLESLS